MNLTRRLKRLEDKSYSLLRCLSCQDLAASGAKEIKSAPVPKDSVVKKCMFCGSRFGISLQSYSNHERELIILLVESDPIKGYFDERSYSAARWILGRLSQINIYEKAMADDNPLRFYLPYPPPSLEPNGSSSGSSLDKKQDPKNADLKKRADSYTRREVLRITRLINAPEAFPVDGTVNELKARIQCRRDDHVGSLSNKLSIPADLLEQVEYELNACFSHLENLKAREAHELILWGQSLEVTQQEIEFFEHEIDKKTNEMSRKYPITNNNPSKTVSLQESVQECSRLPNNLNGEKPMCSTDNTSEKGPSIGASKTDKRHDAGPGDLSSVSNGSHSFKIP